MAIGLKIGDVAGKSGAKVYIDDVETKVKEVKLVDAVDDTLPYDFYNGSAVVYNNEIHILGSEDSSNRRKHYKWNGSSWTLPIPYYVTELTT